MPSGKFFKTLIYIIVGSFLIIFLLIQPYNLFCKISGKCQIIFLKNFLHHKIGQRELDIEFIGKISKNLQNKIEFYPINKASKIKAGESIQNFYHVKNLSDKTIIITADYEIIPHDLDQHLEKIECLCMQKQVLKSKEEAQMPVNLRINSKFEKDQNLSAIKTVRIIYEAKRF